MQFINFISERIKTFFSGNGPGRPEETDPDSFQSREKIVAFSIAFFIALCLWFIVNLNRDFNITIQVPVQLTNLPDDLTLRSEMPENATVSLTGEGWKLISVYSNPPRVLVNAESEEVNLAEQIRSQVGAFSDLNVVQVNPNRLVIETDRKASKTVPLVNMTNISLRDRYGLLEEPAVRPDSVTIIGAESRIAEINEWHTEEIDIRDVNQSVEREIRIARGNDGIIVTPETAVVRLHVAEFTEAEVRVPIRTRNLPSGSAVSYNPSSITVRFDVPIAQYSEIQGVRAFSAYVDYSVIENDDSGRITPEIEIEETGYVVRLRSFQPPRVSYFRVIPE